MKSKRKGERVERKRRERRKEREREREERKREERCDKPMILLRNFAESTMKTAAKTL